MGITKSNLFSAAQNELAQMAKVLAHPARIAILQHLLTAKTCINGTLVQELGLAQPTISQHLRELKEIGLIQGTIEGASMNYCINPKKWIKVKGLFLDLFERLDHSCDSDACCK